MASGSSSGCAWAATGGEIDPSAQPLPSGLYLLLLHATQSLADELDVLARECGQLAVARTQVHILRDTARLALQEPQLEARQLSVRLGSAPPYLLDDTL